MSAEQSKRNAYSRFQKNTFTGLQRYRSVNNLLKPCTLKKYPLKIITGEKVYSYTCFSQNHPYMEKNKSLNNAKKYYVIFDALISM